MKIVIAENRAILSGSLGEMDTEGSIVNFFNGFVANQNNEKRILVDVGELAGANSSGIRNWINAIRNCGVSITYDKVPFWLASQFSCLYEFFDNNAQIKSLYVPFYSKKRDDIVYKLMNIGTDIPFLDNYDDFSLTAEENGEVLELDACPSAFLIFMIDFATQLKGITV